MEKTAKSKPGSQKSLDRPNMNNISSSNKSKDISKEIKTSMPKFEEPKVFFFKETIDFY